MCWTWTWSHTREQLEKDTSGSRCSVPLSGQMKYCKILNIIKYQVVIVQNRICSEFVLFPKLRGFLHLNPHESIIWMVLYYCTHLPCFQASWNVTGNACPSDFSSNFLGGRKGSIFHKRQLGQHGGSQKHEQANCYFCVSHFDLWFTLVYCILLYAGPCIIDIADIQ